MGRINYTDEFKKEVINARYKHGISLRQLTKIYKVSMPTIIKWSKEYSGLFPEKVEYMNIIRQLNQEKAENEKLNRFYKKVVPFISSANRSEVYSFIVQHKKEFGVRWLLDHLSVVPRAYYNFLNYKPSKLMQEKRRRKSTILALIKSIYDKHHGAVGYPTMKIYLERKGFSIGRSTAHIYMNKELDLKCVIRRKRQRWKTSPFKRIAYPNLLNRDFRAKAKNKKWVIDFTYLTLANGFRRYNCTVVDLYDRSVVASVSSRKIDSLLAIRTVRLALKRQKTKIKDLILHSDQGVQFFSSNFKKFCIRNSIRQSMSKAGCPYDNAVMERYFNTFKNEFINLHKFHNEKHLYTAIKRFTIKYNFERPHSYNNYLTPLEKRALSPVV